MAEGQALTTGTLGNNGELSSEFPVFPCLFPVSPVVKASVFSNPGARRRTVR